MLFETLMDDEEGHIDFIETEIDLLDRIGEVQYGALNGAPAGKAPQG